MAGEPGNEQTGHVAIPRFSAVSERLPAGTWRIVPFPLQKELSHRSDPKLSFPSLNESTQLDSLLGPSADPLAAGWRLRELSEGAAGNGADLLTALQQRADVLQQSDPAIVGALLRVVHSLALKVGPDAVAQLDPTLVVAVESALPENAPNRHLLLQLLSLNRSDQALTILFERLKVDPPEQWIEAAQVLSPMMQHQDWNVAAIYPAAVECLEHPSLAAPLLDLANYITRISRVTRHPMAEQLSMLNLLLGEVSGRLSQFEDNPRVFGDDVDTVQARLGEAVALAVSLCDAVGLIGDESSIGKLNQTVNLKHRRVQCEAAGALAKLGDELGQKRLLDLTADPAARLRAIQYADELGFGELVEPEQRSDNATAEAELSLWLSQPQQMGVPPTGIEVIDSRRMLWPSFNDPVDVHLVRFEYSFADSQYSNVGIAGPVTFALSCDVADLPTDDIFSIYAGWHADHPEIFAVPAESFNDAQARAMEPLKDHLDQLGYESIRPALIGFFLDEKAGIFEAVRDATACVVVTDGLETVDHPVAGRIRPLSAGDLFNLYKGRKMLRTFNPSSE